MESFVTWALETDPGSNVTPTTCDMIDFRKVSTFLGLSLLGRKMGLRVIAPHRAFVVLHESRGEESDL
jgi:hypothetical protein